MPPEADDEKTKNTTETGSATDATSTTDSNAKPDSETDDGSQHLGDKGKQALDRMKSERNGYRDQLAAFTALGLGPDDLKKLIDSSEESKRTAEQTRAQRDADSAAIAKANERLVRAEVRAAATGKLANPARAMQLLDLSKFDVNDDGEVDSDAITAAIDDLLKTDPYLAAKTDGKRFEGSGDGGPKGEPGKPQLTEADVKRLAKEGKHAEIEQARVDGRLNTLLGIGQ